MKIVAIIQARMGSTRLKGKVLKELCGKSILHHIIERVSQSNLIHTIITATTTEETDNEIVQFCSNQAFHCFRGSEHNVLERYFKCAELAKADIIVRVTADDPFKDPKVIDKAINLLIQGEYDYVSNTIHPTYPEGIDIEVFTFNALAKAYAEAKLLSEQEHVTPYIWKNKNKFKVLNFEYPQNLSELRWTLDNPKDYAFVEAIYSRLYKPNYIFYMEDILDLLEKEPYLSEINTGIIRNEGYLKSLKQDNHKQL